MLIEYEGRFNILEKLLSEHDDIEETIFFHSNEGEVVKCNQQVVKERDEVKLDKNFMVSMAKENVQQLVDSGVQLMSMCLGKVAKCKEKIEKLWIKKSVKKRTNKEEKLQKKSASGKREDNNNIRFGNLEGLKQQWQKKWSNNMMKEMASYKVRFGI